VIVNKFMSPAADILAIDDDKLSRKIIKQALDSTTFNLRTANDGEAGLNEALRVPPDIILLDVEMPGMNGYEVCEHLRQRTETQDTPVVFLSSHSSIRERMQGYEVGADDYIVKPFEAEHLIARINVLLKYKEQRQELKAQYEMARKTAMLAMTGSSELGIAMQFLEKSYAYTTFDELAQGLFETTDRLRLSCCLLIDLESKPFWFCSEGSIKPLEKELIEMADKKTRFFDFGTRTIVNYQIISLLIKDMPLDDMERYGRLKDLMPVLLSAIYSKTIILNTENALEEQSKELLSSFGKIRTSFYYLVQNLLENQQQSTEVLRRMIRELSMDLLRMGLDDDQEEYLLARIDGAVEEASAQIDAREDIRKTFSIILPQLQGIIRQQETLVEAYNASHTIAPLVEHESFEGDIELF
jgi:CheY-like chemotaxis protein